MPRHPPGGTARWSGGSIAMILSIADSRAAAARAARVGSPQHYCGPCYDAESEINDLVPIKLWSADGEAIRGHYCPCCGVEFQQ